MRFIGLASIASTWLAILFVTIRSQRVYTKSISHHAALDESRYYPFAILMTVSVALMWVFMTLWLAPTLSLPMSFNALVTVVVILELIATWVPLVEGWKYKAHEMTSYGAAVLVPVILLYMLFSPTISRITSAVSIAAITAMISFFFLYFFVKATHKNHLIYQSAYILAFHIVLLTVIFSA